MIKDKLTVGELKKIIQNLPDDSEVWVMREDSEDERSGSIILEAHVIGDTDEDGNESEFLELIRQ